MRDQCLQFAGDVKNPWALAHGICAFGTAFPAADGRKAAEVITADFLARNPGFDGGPATGSPYGFARYAADKTPIEPHTHLMVKTLVLGGDKPGTKYPTAWGTVTLAELIASVKVGFRHVPDREEYWRDVGWTLDLLSHVLKPGKAAKFQTSDQQVDFNAVMDDALTYLEKSQADLQMGLEKGLPQVDKRKQGIYAHACGGLHLVQAVFGWARFPEVKKAWGKRLDTQIAILFYRLESERRQYDAALEQAPQYRLQILTQMLKFYGHFLETTARLKDESGWKPTATQKQAVMKARALLDATLRQLDADKTFSKMAEIKKSSPQVYLDLIGDACHAAHGWDGWQ
ncbi:MAG: hypothetical protein H6Q89_232 [Myxococcaceae bacterium]|nr:hypothetical protein [Myxococcaceae bacterium]